MEWPSKRVQPGGIFQPAKVNYSPETRNFIKVLLDESKLTMLQRQKVDYSLRSNEPLPTLKSKSGMLAPSRQSRVTIRPGTPKKRSQSTIVKSGAYIREMFVPQLPRVDRDKAKKHLQDHMAFGKDVVPTPRKPKLKPKGTNNEALEDYNRFDEILREIDERKEFLQEMENLGEGPKYRPLIEQQIQAKLREMQRLKTGQDEPGFDKEM